MKSGFLFGFVVGAAVVFCGLKYHVVQAGDGFHLVPKATADFSGAYVDIRNFSWSDWNEHRELAVALAKNDQGNLLTTQAGENFQQMVSGALEAFRPQTQSSAWDMRR